MLRFKLGAVLGFALGWLVGSGRVEEILDEFQGSARGRRAHLVPAPGRLDRTA